MRWRALLPAALLPVLAMGCGVPTDREPRAIPDERVPFGLLDPEPTSTTSAPPTATSTARITVFLVDGDRLAPVARDVPAPPTPDKALRALLGGARREEVAANVRTALGAAAGASATAADGLVRVELGTALPSTAGREQVLAVAQIVYTLTALPGVDAVTFTLSGRAVEVPAGDGTLTSGALRRSDYASVAQL
ncbi:MAG: GerMN domain-containing protein [Acidimicrobiales bacterium]